MIERLTCLKETVLLLCDINPSYVILISYAVRAGETQGSSASLCTCLCIPESVNDFIVLNEKERVIKRQSQVAEIFNEYFTNITKDLIIHKHTTFRDQAHVNGIPMGSHRPVNTFGLRSTDHHVVKAILNNMKPNKAPGHDLILSRAVKASSSSIAKPFSDLVNTIIAKSKVPDS